jgi:hypothetical protein
MKSIILSCIAGVAGATILLSTVFADRSMDVAYDIQNHIPADKITAEVINQIDARLQYIYEHDESEVDTLAAQDKQSLRDLLVNMRNIAVYYQKKNTPKPVLSYILSRSEDIYAMTDADVSPEGPMVTYILLSTYYQDLASRYQIHVERDNQLAEKKKQAPEFVPE